MKRDKVSSKVFVYIFVTVLVVWALDSVRINQIFKKNKEVQAKVFYALLAFALIYLISNFIFDFLISSKI